MDLEGSVGWISGIVAYQTPAELLKLYARFRCQFSNVQLSGSELAEASELRN